MICIAAGQQQPNFTACGHCRKFSSFQIGKDSLKPKYIEDV